jgi:hypothetical protein
MTDDIPEILVTADEISAVVKYHLYVSRDKLRDERNHAAITTDIRNDLEKVHKARLEPR